MSEDFNHIDQIIRQKFENFEPEPPAEVWDRIKSGIPKTPPPSSPGLLLPIIVAVSLLIFVAGLFHQFYHNTGTTLTTDGSGITIQSASLGSTGSTTTTDNSLQESFIQAGPAVSIAADDAPPVVLEPKTTTIPVRAPFNQEIKPERKKKNSNQVAQNNTISSSRATQLNPALIQALKSGELTYSDAVKYNLSARDFRKLNSYREESRAKIASWSLGLYFNPEMTSCKDQSIENTLSYNLSLLPEISFHRFFIQSGINARFTHDKGNMTVDYNSYLGSYEDVYNITFDTVNGEVIPTFYTTTVDVWDTIAHYAVSEKNANYTYLEVPVMFGYRYTFGKVSLFAKAGPSASFLVGKRIPEAVNPEDHAKIVNVDYPVPLRSTVNWQMLVGAGIDYGFSDKISFSLEPTYRFGLKSEYDLPSGANNNTRSFGIRAGLHYKF